MKHKIHKSLKHLGFNIFLIQFRLFRIIFSSNIRLENCFSRFSQKYISIFFLSEWKSKFWKWDHWYFMCRVPRTWDQTGPGPINFWKSRTNSDRLVPRPGGPWIPVYENSLQKIRYLVKTTFFQLEIHAHANKPCQKK